MLLLVVIHRFDRGLMWHSIIHDGFRAAIASLSVGRKICMNLDSKTRIESRTKCKPRQFPFIDKNLHIFFRHQCKSIDFAHQSHKSTRCGLLSRADV